MPDSIEQWRERLRAQLRRAPARVNDGGIQTARDFKRFHKEASKELAKAKLSAADLFRLQRQFDDWYSGARNG